MKAKSLNPSLAKIIHLLRDGHYQDGNTLGEKLHMTRAAVWKTVKKIQGYGVKIDSMRGKGYALKDPLVLLDAKQINAQLNNDVHLSVFESIGSTNDYLKSVKTSDKPVVCLAEQQINGRGRMRRSWYSPFGQNIYMSCLYPLQKDISELSGLSLVVGLAIAKTLNYYSDQSCFKVKWPNDVLYQDKKISGTLIDIQAESHGASCVIIGVGVNVNMLNANRNISQQWISLREITNTYIDRNQLCAELIKCLFAYLGEFKLYGLSRFVEEWMKVDGLLNKVITLNYASEKVTGKAAGINERGQLVLQLSTGKTQAFSSGDTAIVK